jgi:hypothetical protein
LVWRKDELFDVNETFGELELAYVVWLEFLCELELEEMTSFCPDEEVLCGCSYGDKLIFFCFEEFFF